VEAWDYRRAIRAKGTVSPISVTFTHGKTGTYRRTVTVTGVDDVVADGNVAYTIVTAPGRQQRRQLTAAETPPTSSVTNADNDTAGITGLFSNVGARHDRSRRARPRFTVVLTSQPTAGVSIGLSSSNAGEGTVSPTSVFGSLPPTGTWPQNRDNHRSRGCGGRRQCRVYDR